MITLHDTAEAMRWQPAPAILLLMEFVHDIRRSRSGVAIAQPLSPGHERFDALAASTAEHLCAELGLDPPGWLAAVEGCRHPWFVSGLESLKAIAIARARPTSASATSSCSRTSSIEHDGQVRGGARGGGDPAWPEGAPAP